MDQVSGMFTLTYDYHDMIESSQSVPTSMSELTLTSEPNENPTNLPINLKRTFKISSESPAFDKQYCQ